jgi:hypothetical protein
LSSTEIIVDVHQFLGTKEELMDVLIRLPIDISHIINEFCKGFFVEIILDGKKFISKAEAKVSVPFLSETILPLITKNDFVKEESQGY